MSISSTDSGALPTQYSAAYWFIRSRKAGMLASSMVKPAAEYWVGKAPESVLEIDMELHQPGRVTLQEVEALSALEPYGSGNARPLFCLMGATLLRTQNVGQNRHLKLRLGKGSAQFDGIFFSTVAESCGCPGTR